MLRKKRYVENLKTFFASSAPNASHNNLNLLIAGVVGLHSHAGNTGSNPVGVTSKERS
jgi:hypothetical protein